MNAPVYVVDDDTGVRDELVELLRGAGLTAKGFASGEALLDVAASLEPGCVVLDLALPGIDGVAVQSAMRSAGLAHEVVMLTGRATVPAAVSSLTGGAVHFLEKPFRGPALLQAIATAHHALATKQAAQAERDDGLARLARLTPREREVLDGIVAGLPNKLVAHRLGISVRTVELYRATAMAKLDVGGLAEATRLCLIAGRDPAQQLAV